MTKTKLLAFMMAAIVPLGLCANGDTMTTEENNTVLSDDAPKINVGEVYTVDSSEPYFLVDDRFITQPELGGYKNVTPYTSVDELIFDTDYRVNFYDYKGWDGEAGRYRVIRIYHCGEEILNFIDEDAWKGIPSRFLSYSSTPTNDNVLLFSLGNGIRLLAFIGVTYASQPPMFTLIAVKNGIAKVVFNMPFVLKSISKTSNNIEFILGDAYEGTSGEFAPQYYRLYSTDDGSLHLEKNDL